MSQPPQCSYSLDSYLECHIRQDTVCTTMSCEPSNIPVKRPFTATQARNQHTASLKPLSNILEEDTEHALPLSPDILFILLESLPPPCSQTFS